MKIAPLVSVVCYNLVAGDRQARDAESVIITLVREILPLQKLTGSIKLCSSTWVTQESGLKVT